MTLKKNLMGLVFFFFLNLTFSQQQQFLIASETLKKRTIVKTANVYLEIDNNPNRLTTIMDRQKEVKVYNFLSETSTPVSDTLVNFIVESLPINSKKSDYAPSFYNGELVFASSRKSKSLFVILQGDTNEPFSDLYTTSKNAEKKGVLKLKGNINTKFHESSAAFSPDGKTVYFTRNNYSKGNFKRNAEGYVSLKIYKATYDNKQWTNISELPFNSDEYSIAHPTLSVDGRFLYFASDMPGSLGKSDIYVVEIYEDGSYSNPKNMGKHINSSGRETFPYISAKGNLFFASDGRIGYGGLDIFVATPNNNDQNLEVYNLGAPINSPQDDFTFIIDDESNIGYFASNREGGKGGDDIYGFKQLVPQLEYQQIPKIKRKLKRHIEHKPFEKEITSY